MVEQTREYPDAGAGAAGWLAESDVVTAGRETNVEIPTLVSFVESFAKTRLQFLLLHMTQPGDPEKPPRCGPTEHRHVEDTIAPGTSQWESTTHDYWYTEICLWRTIEHMGHGLQVHCTRCDFETGCPDGRGDCSAHSVEFDVRRVVPWLQHDVLGRPASAPMEGTTEQAVTHLPMDKDLSDLSPRINLTEMKCMAVDAPTGAGEAHAFRGKLEAALMRAGVRDP